ncbi:MAG TPA: ABC transporter permease [Thermomicrobiales bacterium]|nr:ABC transporter permease [Thermomicrobiales bacterium]
MNDRALRRPSRLTQAQRILVRHPNMLVGAVLLAIIVVAAAGASVIMTHDPNLQTPSDRLLPPSSTHFLGTDGQGRDVFSRMIKGAQLSLLVGVAVATLTCLAGGAIGLVSGFMPRVDAVVMRIMDGLMAFPSIILAIGIMAVRGAEVSNVIFALTVVNTPRMARIVRSVVQSTAEAQFVEAAESIGVSTPRLLLRHITPNCLSPVIVQTSFVFAEAVLGEATLSFLGAGAPPDVPSWGGMLSESRVFLSQAPWTMLVPGAALTLTVFALNLIGDGIRDVLDPRLRQR